MAVDQAGVHRHPAEVLVHGGNIFYFFSRKVMKNDHFPTETSSAGRAPTTAAASERERCEFFFLSFFSIVLLLLSERRNVFIAEEEGVYVLARRQPVQQQLGGPGDSLVFLFLFSIYKCGTSVQTM